jgi:hypothetical protein
VQFKHIVLTPTQVKNLFATPVEVLPALGPGRVPYVFACVARLRYATTDYAGANDITIGFWDSGTFRFLTSLIPVGFLTQSDDELLFANPDVQAWNNYTSSSTILNKPLKLTINALPEYTLGDSPIDIWLLYDVIQFT